MPRSKAASAAPVRRGRKDPSLLAPAPERAKVTNTYICGVRPMKMGEIVLMKGVEVPGAASWPRLEAWTGARRVLEVREGQSVIPFEEYKAGWELATRLEQERVGEILARALDEQATKDELAVREAEQAPAKQAVEDDKTEE